MIVKKYGGSCLRDQNAISQVAKQIYKQYIANEESVIVVSAMQGVTNSLNDMSLNYHGRGVQVDVLSREHDKILCTGEEIAASLLVITLNKLGVPAKSYNAFSAGIVYDEERASFEIKAQNKIRSDLKQRIVPVITGFQALDKQGELITLGRNSSDLSAILIGQAFNAEECHLYKDVPGIFTSNPKKTKPKYRYQVLNIDDAVALLKGNDQVVHMKVLECLKRNYLRLKIVNVKNQNEFTEISNDSASILVRHEDFDKWRDNGLQLNYRRAYS